MTRATILVDELVVFALHRRVEALVGGDLMALWAHVADSALRIAAQVGCRLVPRSMRLN